MARQPTKTTAAAKPAKGKTGTAVAKWDEELAALAQKAKGLEDSVGGGNFISTRSGRLSYNGAEIPGNAMNVIIVDHILENHYYEGRFDPDTPQSPVCFAFGEDEDDMVPHDKSVTPQCGDCKSCPMNEFGSADTGKGKACKNIRRLAVIAEDGMDDIEGATLAFFKVPVTSVKAWAGFVRQVADTLGRPPLGVITEISVVPDAKSQFKVNFKVVEKIEDGDVLQALLAKRAQAATELVVPYSPPAEDEAPQARGRGGKALKGQKKPAAAQKSARGARR
jgi:hypothetical protein